MAKDKTYYLTDKQRALVGRKYRALEASQRDLQATMEGLMVGVGLDMDGKDWEFSPSTMAFTLKKKEKSSPRPSDGG